MSETLYGIPAGQVDSREQEIPVTNFPHLDLIG